jgi:tetratricopeptide (TPR) repeat protein
LSASGVSRALQTALAAHKAGRLAEAAAAYETILKIEPDNADALHLAGLIALQRGDAAGALARIGRAAALNPRNAAYHMNLGRARQAAGQLEDARASFRRAAEFAPNESAVWHYLGLASRAAGDLSGAIDAYQRAAQISPQDIAALNNLAAALLEQGRADDARPVIARALALDANNALALGNEGQSLLLLNRPDEAIAPLRRAAALMPDNALALSNLGMALQEARQAGEAVTVLQRAVEMAPDSPIVRVAYGNALKKAERYDDALAQFERALALRPDIAEVWSHIGTCHENMLRYERGVTAYDRALELKPDHPRARQNRAMALLTLGRFKNGWRDYALRDKRPVLPGVTFLVEPHGEGDIDGRHILLCGEQGLGDELFFLRFLPELRRRGAARVNALTNPKIAPLLARLDGLDAVFTRQGDAPAADRVIAMGDLPLVLRMTTAGQIPPSLALSPLAAQRDAIAARLAAFGPPPYIGVTWRAGIADRFDALFKLAPLAELGAVLTGLPGTFVALQRLPQDGELAALADAIGQPVHDMTALNDDLEAMLALLAQLDDYVCVSNTNVHLRAMTGRTSRVLAPCPPEFRWMVSGVESPWFPGSPVYRQDVARSWTRALTDLRRDL